MKKLLLLAAAGLMCIPGANATAKRIKVPANPTFVTTLETGKKYLIYDATKVTADQDRTAFRYVETTNDQINGDHDVTPAVGGLLTKAENEAYLWYVTGDEKNGWHFQNVANDKYIPTSNNDGHGNMIVVAEQPTYAYKFVEQHSQITAFIVQHTNGGDGSAWDGRTATWVSGDWTAGPYQMTNWAKQDDTANNHWYQFIEYTEDMLVDVTDVTLNLKSGDDTKTFTVRNVEPGIKVSALVPVYWGFECATGGDAIVSADETTFTIEGNWKYLDKVGRIHNRLGQGARRFWSYDATANNVKTQKSEYANAPTTDRLFKLNGKIEGNKLYVNVQNVVAGEGKYLNVENSNNNTASFTETEQWFEVRPSGYSDQGFMLVVSGNTCVQDYYGNPTLGAYTGDCTNDPSAVISFFEVTEESATAAFTNAVNALVGEGVGNYSFTEEGLTAKSELMATVDANPLAIALDSYTEKYDALVEARSLNMPVAGRFYRLKGYNNYYLNNKEITIGDATRIQMQPTGDGNNGAKSVVYYSADGNLVSLLDGEVLGNFSDDARCFVMKDSGNAGVITFEEGTQTGKYLIKVSGSAKNYYAFGGWTDASNHQYEVDRGEGSVAGDARYYWTIEELTPGSYLPLPVADGETAISFYLPCALKVKTDRLTGYTLEMNVGETEDNQPVSEVVKTSTEEAMAANTVHYAELATNATISDGSVFLQIDSYSEAVAQNGESAIKGEFYTFTKPADKSYFHAITTTGSDKFFSLNNDATTVKGFTGYIEMAAPSDHAKANGYKLVSEKTPTTGIEEIVAGGENGAEVIYDLQGRRVANASKGIFIINGVKTLVK